MLGDLLLLNTLHTRFRLFISVLQGKLCKKVILIEVHHFLKDLTLILVIVICVLEVLVWQFLLVVWLLSLIEFLVCGSLGFLAPLGVLLVVDGDCGLLTWVFRYCILRDLHILSTLEWVFGLPSILMRHRHHHLPLDVMYLLSLIKVTYPHHTWDLALLLWLLCTHAWCGLASYFISVGV